MDTETPVPPQCSVVRPWLALHCTMKMQTVLLSALRGCDGIPKEDVSKKFTRKLRHVILFPANPRVLLEPRDSFMKSTITAEDVRKLLSNLDPYPVHWLGHFNHACEIVGYKHPDLEIRTWWFSLYQEIVHGLHYNVETEAQLDRRLCDADDGD